MRQRVVLLLAVVLAACGSDQNMVPRTGPELVQEVTLMPTTPAPTRLLSPTPSPIVIPVTSEIISPLEIVTIEADFEVITPTLPPTKTMTPTPSITPTVTITPIPSSTIPATLTLPPSPSPIFVQVPIYPTAVLNQPPPQQFQAPVSVIAVDCESAWFFISNPLPTSCPSNPASSSRASYTEFESGYMFWIENQDAIYVVYDSEARPRWEVFIDTFEEGMMERDPAFSNNPAYTFQPGRGFGLIWRSNQALRTRIGWAQSEWEIEYQVNIQIGQDGTIFFDAPRGGVYALSPDGADAKLYDTF